MSIDLIWITNFLPIKLSEERSRKNCIHWANSLLSFFKVSPASHNHVRCRVCNREQSVYSRLELPERCRTGGRWGRFCRAWRQRSLSCRCRSLVSRRNCHRVTWLVCLWHWVRRRRVVWEVARQHHGLLKAHCRCCRWRGGGCWWAAEVAPSLAVEVAEHRTQDQNHRARWNHEVDRSHMNSFER